MDAERLRAEHPFRWDGGPGDSVRRPCCDRPQSAHPSIAAEVVRDLVAERDTLREALARSEAALRTTRHYLVAALEAEVITCHCWGAMGCDAHEQIADLDDALAAHPPATGDEWEAGS